jgi:hypothetical protein
MFFYHIVEGDFLFISNQKIIIDSAIERLFVDKCRALLIKGKSGVGKSYVLKEVEKVVLQKHNTQVFYISGDKYFSNRKYYPFLAFMKAIYADDNSKLMKDIIESELKTAIPTAIKTVPAVGDLLSVITDVGLSSKQKLFDTRQQIYTSDEIQFLMKLEYVTQGKNALFFLEDIQYWDLESLKFLSLLLTIDKHDVTLEKALFIATYKTEGGSTRESAQILNDIIKQLAGSSLTVNPIRHSEYGEVLYNFGLKSRLLNETVDAIFSITNGHLQMTRDIIQSANDHINDPEIFLKIIEEQDVQKIIEDRLLAYGATGAMIDEMLKFGSLFGQSFSVYEIQSILVKEEAEVRHLVNQANNLYLINKTSNGASFVHEVIREIFKKKTDEKQYKYYKSFSEALKLLRPSDFLDRAESLLKAGSYNEAAVLYVLDYLKKARLQDSVLVSDNIFDFFVNNSDHRDYYSSMASAYDFYYRLEYDACIDELNSINDIFDSVLIAEKYYLMSITYSKYFDADSRNKAIEVLLPYCDKSNLNNETEIWQRIMSALMIAYVHNNKVAEAKKIERALMYDLSIQAKYDINAAAKLNIIRRKSSSIHTPNIACKFIAKSIAFFGPKDNLINDYPFDVKEYYMALTNYAANSLCSGNYMDGYIKAGEALRLPASNKRITFERIFMPFNNYVISGLMAKKITLPNAYSYLEKISDMRNVKDVDKIIIDVNLAILNALLGNMDSSLTILSIQKTKIDANRSVEFFYKNLVYSNYIALLYLHNRYSGIHKEAEGFLTEILKTENPYWIKRATALLNTIKSEFHAKNSIDWFDNALSLNNENSSIWHFYSRGFLFGELEYWSES